VFAADDLRKPEVDRWSPSRRKPRKGRRALLAAKVAASYASATAGFSFSVVFVQRRGFFSRTASTMSNLRLSRPEQRLAAVRHAVRTSPCAHAYFASVPVDRLALA
jgi:hypothetical protein